MGRLLQTLGGDEVNIQLRQDLDVAREKLRVAEAECCAIRSKLDAEEGRSKLLRLRIEELESDQEEGHNQELLQRIDELCEQLASADHELDELRLSLEVERGRTTMQSQMSQGSFASLGRSYILQEGSEQSQDNDSVAGSAVGKSSCILPENPFQ